MGVYPKMNGIFHGKSHLEMDDDWGTPIDENSQIRITMAISRRLPGQLAATSELVEEVVPGPKKKQGPGPLNKAEQKEKWCEIATIKCDIW